MGCVLLLELPFTFLNLSAASSVGGLRQLTATTGDIWGYTKASKFGDEPSLAESSAKGDPHFRMADGGQADIRGTDGGAYCLLSASNLSLNVVFHEVRRLVEHASMLLLSTLPF